MSFNYRPRIIVQSEGLTDERFIATGLIDEETEVFLIDEETAQVLIEE